MESIGLRNLYNNFTLPISDNSCGKGFRAFPSSSFDRVYFNTNNEEEGNNVQEMSTLLKLYLTLLLSKLEHF